MAARIQSRFYQSARRTLSTNEDIPETTNRIAALVRGY
jgi:hypothetical protein